MLSIDSVLEELRSKHEEKERLEEAMVKEMMNKKTTHRDQINSDHRLKYLLGVSVFLFYLMDITINNTFNPFLLQTEDH